MRGKKETWRKQCIGGIVAIMLVFISSLPQTVEAASYTLAWPLYLGEGYHTPSGSAYPTNEQGAITVEAGQKNFYIGDYVYETIEFRNLSTHPDVTYRSENPSIASVNKSTGLVQVKKSGTVRISIKYRTKKTTCTIQVVKKGSIQAAKKTPASLAAKAQELIKVYRKQLTSDNCYEVNDAMVQLEKVMPKNKKILNQKGFACKKGSATQQLILPELGRYATIKQEMKQYVKKSNPIGTNKNSVFRIQSVSGGNKTVTVRLKKNVTQTQLFAIQKETTEDTAIQKTSQANFTLYVKDLSSGQQYTATAAVQKGSKEMTITLPNSLKAGHQYRLIGKETDVRNMKYGWTKGKTVSVK